MLHRLLLRVAHLGRWRSVLLLLLWRLMMLLWRWITVQHLLRRRCHPGVRRSHIACPALVVAVRRWLLMRLLLLLLLLRRLTRLLISCSHLVVQNTSARVKGNTDVIWTHCSIVRGSGMADTKALMGRHEVVMAHAWCRTGSLRHRLRTGTARAVCTNSRVSNLARRSSEALPVARVTRMICRWLLLTGRRTNVTPAPTDGLSFARKRLLVISNDVFDRIGPDG